MDETNSTIFDESIDATSIGEINIDDVESTPSMCLIINQEYQQQLEEFICLIEDKLEENRERQAYLKEKIKKRQSSASTTNNSYINFITPYFRDHKGLHPPENEDAKLKQLNGELNQNYVCAIKKWTNTDEKNLLNTVKEFYIKDQLEQLRKRKNQLLIDLKVAENDKFSLEKVQADIDECNRQIQKSIDSSLISINNDLENKIDWLFVSKLIDDVYDNLNCKLYWINYLHPQINKQDWSAEETDRLGELTKNQEHFDWERIAQRLGTSRKAWQVAKQYQITFNSNIKHHGPFTDEEIDHLSSVIERCRIGDYIPWNQVYYFVDGRSTFQLKTFWDKYQKRNMKKEYWTLLEDTVLHVGYVRFSANWKTIAFYLPGRTNRQCRERYVNRLAISKRRIGNWSIAEDKQLSELVVEHGSNYKEIIKSMNCRSENQIKSRCKVLKRAKENSEKPSYKKNKIFELETIRLIYLKEKVKRIRNLDSFLNSARKMILNGLDREQMKKDDLELLKIKLARKNITKQQADEEKVDSEIVKMFDHYNLIPSKFQQRPNSISADNLRLDEVVRNYLDCLLNGQQSTDDYLLNHVIKYLFKNKITDFSEINNLINDDDSIHSSIRAAPILPPNKTTMLGFFGVLMQKDNLQKFIQEESQNEQQIRDFDLEELRSDPEYRRLVDRFYSLFLLPAILTDTRLPSSSNDVNSNSILPPQQLLSNEDNEENNGNNSNGEKSIIYIQNDDLTNKETSDQIEVKKTKKRKNSLEVKHERQTKVLITTKIRQQQKDLIDSFIKFRDKNSN